MNRSTEIERIAGIFLGDWVLTVTNQWWLDDPTTIVKGSAKCRWVGEAFLLMEAEFDGVPAWEFVFGRSDANDRFVVLYHDERGVQRVFDLAVDDEGWLMTRSDPDFHQRIGARLEDTRMVGETEASDDEGATWRKDFDLIWDPSSRPVQPVG